MVITILKDFDKLFEGLSPEFDVSNLSYKTVSRNSSYASVKVRGNVKIKMLFTSSDFYFDEVWIFRKEDGGWKFCSS